MSEFYNILDCEKVSKEQANGCAALLGGEYNEKRKEVSLDPEMTGAQVRKALGVLWAGVCLKSR